LTLSNVYAFILAKLLIVRMGFPRLGSAFYTDAAHEYTVYGSSMQATRLQRPQGLIEGGVSSSSLRKYYQSSYQENGHL
jgi:hypothetical protein